MDAGIKINEQGMLNGIGERTCFLLTRKFDLIWSVILSIEMKQILILFLVSEVNREVDKHESPVPSCSHARSVKKEKLCVKLWFKVFLIVDDMFLKLN